MPSIPENSYRYPEPQRTEATTQQRVALCSHVQQAVSAIEEALQEHARLTGADIFDAQYVNRRNFGETLNLTQHVLRVLSAQLPTGPDGKVATKDPAEMEMAEMSLVFLGKEPSYLTEESS